MAGQVVRFKRVLRVREVERELTQSELAQKLREEETICNTIDTMTAKRDDALSDFCSGSERILSPQQLWFERQNLEVMEKELNVAGQVLELCRSQIEETKVELLEKHRNVQLMERYVGRLKEQEEKKILAEEQKNLDDITSMRYLRNLRGGAEA